MNLFLYFTKSNSYILTFTPDGCGLTLAPGGTNTNTRSLRRQHEVCSTHIASCILPSAGCARLVAG